MAKKDYQNQPLKNWQEVDLTLAAMNGLARKILELRQKIEPQIEALAKELNESTAASLMKLDQQEGRIRAFCLSHLEEFAQQKSRKLPNGQVAIRATCSVAIEDEEKTCQVLRQLGKLECLKETCRPVRAAIKNLPPALLEQVGASLVEDTQVKVTPNVVLR